MSENTEKPYFVMLNSQDGKILPMINCEEEISMYETTKDAIHDAEQNPLGHAFGFEVFDKNSGCT
ncbi:MAG: hypothetical protein WC375_00095 [Methanomassiliicoccales archaeon]